MTDNTLKPFNGIRTFVYPVLSRKVVVPYKSLPGYVVNKINIVDSFYRDNCDIEFKVGDGIIEVAFNNVKTPISPTGDLFIKSILTEKIVDFKCDTHREGEKSTTYTTKDDLFQSYDNACIQEIINVFYNSTMCKMTITDDFGVKFVMHKTITEKITNNTKKVGYNREKYESDQQPDILDETIQGIMVFHPTEAFNYRICLFYNVYSTSFESGFRFISSDSIIQSIPHGNEVIAVSPISKYKLYPEAISLYRQTRKYITIDKVGDAVGDIIISFKTCNILFHQSQISGLHYISTGDENTRYNIKL
jgi:hypothetical protein